MTVYYRVFHQRNPEGAVIVDFPEGAAKHEIIAKAVSLGHFKKKWRSKLEVEKTRLQTRLGAFTGVEGPM